ncbi:MAG: DUF4397 domain-containing protein [Lachnospiraceae bacterium]
MADNDMHYNGTNQYLNPIATDIGFPPVTPPIPGGTGSIGPGTGGNNWLLPEGTPEVSGIYYGQVRFLNASTYNMPVNIAIDDAVYSPNSQFSTISDYGWVADGFHTVTVRRATGPRTLLYQQTFPFMANQMITMILTDSSTGGMELVSVSDTGCSNLPYNISCFRFANMSYSGSDFDLQLSTGETIFNNIDFQAISTYKQAVAGTYQFNVVNSTAFPTPRNLSIIVIGNAGSAAAANQPLVTFDVDLTAGQNMTAYAIGNPWSADYPLQVMVVLDSVQSGLQPFTATS